MNNFIQRVKLKFDLKEKNLKENYLKMTQDIVKSQNRQREKNDF